MSTSPIFPLGEHVLRPSYKVKHTNNESKSEYYSAVSGISYYADPDDDNIIISVPASTRSTYIYTGI